MPSRPCPATGAGATQGSAPDRGPCERWGICCDPARDLTSVRPCQRRDNIAHHIVRLGMPYCIPLPHRSSRLGAGPATPPWRRQLPATEACAAPPSCSPPAGARCWPPLPVWRWQRRPWLKMRSSTRPCESTHLHCMGRDRSPFLGAGGSPGAALATSSQEQPGPTACAWFVQRCCQGSLVSSSTAIGQPGSRGHADLQQPGARSGGGQPGGPGAAGVEAGSGLQARVQGSHGPPPAGKRHAGAPCSSS